MLIDDKNKHHNEYGFLITLFRITIFCFKYVLVMENELCLTYFFSIIHFDKHFSNVQIFLIPLF